MGVSDKGDMQNVQNMNHCIRPHPDASKQIAVNKQSRAVYHYGLNGLAWQYFSTEKILYLLCL